jgi:putative ABC transport system ATP-binding protein
VNTAVAQQARTADFVRLESVRKCYDSAPLGEVALAGVTLSLAEGSFTAVVGPAGSGKSSFLRCAAGLTRPTTGSVMLDGVKLGELDDAELTALRRERIGFLTADANLQPSLTVRQNVLLPLRLAGRDIAADAAEKALEQVGVAELAHHRTEELTAAQRQRVALARALVVDPLVIFADEPVRDLDAAAAGDFLRLLRATGRTVVLTTADPGVAGQADETVHLDGGRIAAA